MPRVIWIIGFCIFAQGTSELMLAGLLPEVAADLHVTIPRAGLLISAFALGMLVGAPVLAVLTLRWPRRRAMLVFLAAFILSHGVGALTGSYAMLFAMRFVGAFAYAGFWAVGGSTAMALAGPARRGQAMSIVAGGLTLATVLGLPAGTWIGQHLGWRGAFWAAAILASLAAIAVAVAARDESLRPEAGPLIRDEVRGLRPTRLWVSYAMTAVATASLLCTFSYLAAMLVEATGLDAAWIPAVLFVYGVGAVIGMAIGGKEADRHPRAILGMGFFALIVVFVALSLAVGQPGGVVLLVTALGLIGFSTNPALNSRILRIAPEAPTLAVAGNVSAFNVGIMLGPWLGGLALSSSPGYAVVARISAVLALAALMLWGGDLVLAARGASPARPGLGSTACLEGGEPCASPPG